MIFWVFFIIIMYLSFAPVRIGRIRYSKLRSCIGIFILFFITIFRFDVGFDYEGYYHNLYPFFNYKSYERLEPMGQLFMNISAYFKTPAVFFLCYGLITLGSLTYVVLKQSLSIFLSFFYYLAFFFLPGLSTIRQEAAICIILFGYCFIQDRKLIHYIVICLIATLFHTSAIISILFYPYFQIKSKKIVVFITLTCFLSLGVIMKLLLAVPAFAAYYHYIVDSQAFQGGSIMRFITLGISLFTFIYSWKKNDLTILKIAACGLIGSAFTLLLGGHIGGRIAEYFTIFLCIGVPNLIYKYYKYQVKTIGIGLGLFFLANIYISTKNPNKSPYTPYQFVFLIDTDKPHFK